MIHETQRRIRPDLPLMKYSGEEMHSADAVVDLMVKAGFDKDRVQVLSVTQVVVAKDMEGLTEFASGPFTDPARAGWTDDEKGRWQEVLKEALEDEKAEYGGVKFDGWVVLTTK